MMTVLLYTAAVAATMIGLLVAVYIIAVLVAILRDDGQGYAIGCRGYRRDAVTHASKRGR